MVYVFFNNNIIVRVTYLIRMEIPLVSIQFNSKGNVINILYCIANNNNLS
jgi:hypothetical protein